MWRRRRQPDPPAGQTQSVEQLSTAYASSKPVVDEPKPKRRRTSAEISNDAIVAEQLAAAEREKELAQVRQVARQVWEQGRRHLPPEPFNADGRFVY
jgi:hypothetical protein